MRKLDEHNRFVLKTGNSRIAKHTNQSDNDIDINTAVVERMARVYNYKEISLKAWYSIRQTNILTLEMFMQFLATNRLRRGGYTCRLFQLILLA